VSLGLGFGYGLLYAIAELGGALLAAGLFRVLRPDEFDHLYFSTGKTYGLKLRLIAEFVGTFVLVMTACLNIAAKSSAGAWSIGACLTCMVYAFGDISGAHLNPAVSLTVVCGARNKCSAMEGGAYVGVQLLAGLSAAYCSTILNHFKSVPLAPPNATYFGIGIGEVFFTFVLCYTVLTLATVDPDRTKGSTKDIYGLGIGFCVVMGGTASGPSSGGVLNPAVAVGIAVVRIMDSTAGFWALPVYVLSQLLGAGLAAGLFFVTHPQEYGKDAPPLPLKN
jgi:glycerol uptake facilitator-like aquaporin